MTEATVTGSYEIWGLKLQPCQSLIFKSGTPRRLSFIRAVLWQHHFHSENAVRVELIMY